MRWEKSGGASRVHVSPELVEVTSPGAPTSKWQQPFDAALTDVFQVQSDIATRAAQALGVALGAGEEKRLAEKPTKNLAAYEAFLKGEEVSSGLARDDPPTLRKALGFYEQAVALDPGFRAGLGAGVDRQLALYFHSTPTPELAERARETAEKAIALAPTGRGLRGARHLQEARPRGQPGAQEQYRQGAEARPGQLGPARAQCSQVERSLGQWDAAVEHFARGGAARPALGRVHRDLSRVLLCLRRYPEARKALDAGLALAPDNLSMIERRAMTFLGEGNLEAARAYSRVTRRRRARGARSLRLELLGSRLGPRATSSGRSCSA